MDEIENDKNDVSSTLQDLLAKVYEQEKLLAPTPTELEFIEKRVFELERSLGNSDR